MLEGEGGGVDGGEGGRWERVKGGGGSGEDRGQVEIGGLGGPCPYRSIRKNRDAVQHEPFRDCVRAPSQRMTFGRMGIYRVVFVGMCFRFLGYGGAGVQRETIDFHKIYVPRLWGCGAPFTQGGKRSIFNESNLNLTTYSPSPIHHFPCIAYGRIPTGSNSCLLVS